MVPVSFIKCLLLNHKHPPIPTQHRSNTVAKPEDGRASFSQSDPFIVVDPVPNFAAMDKASRLDCTVAQLARRICDSSASCFCSSWAS
jgi:hypothetical protein